MIDIDIANRRIALDVPAAELRTRLARMAPPPPRYATGVLAKYARLVSSASQKER